MHRTGVHTSRTRSVARTIAAETISASAPNPVIINTSDVGTAEAGGTLPVTITLEERGEASSENQDACGASGTKLDIIAEQVDPYAQLTPDDEGVICLEAGETRDVTFDVPVPEETGFYDFKISAYGDASGQFYASTDVLTMAVQRGGDGGGSGDLGRTQTTLLAGGGALALLAVLAVGLRE